MPSAAPPGATVVRLDASVPRARRLISWRGRHPVLHGGFLRSAERFPGRPALEVDGSTLTFAALRDQAAAIAATLVERGPGEGPPLTAVFAHRSPTAFTGVLGALFSGHGYVPLHPDFPVARTRSMLRRSGCRTVVVDGLGAGLLDKVLEGVETQLTIVVPGTPDVDDLAGRWPRHTWVGGANLEKPDAWASPAVRPGDIAYLLFTSGSTGVPKGVAVTHANARHLVGTMAERYDVNEADRFSQTFDLTFDLSVFDMFVAWERGACVCCLTGKSLLAPGRFINDNRLTVWFSVPSTAILMKHLGMLKPHRYPSLRWSLFCGEPLVAEMAESWAAAAPLAVLENLYGPTEVTVACTAYRWDPVNSPAQCQLGLVPIGFPLAGMDARIFDDGLGEVAGDGEGELLMAGPQVAPGYWRDPERTATAFVVPPGASQVHYRTGDRVRRGGADGLLRYVGRLDSQIKVHGHRVELGEVEAVLRQVSGLEAAVALGWPPSPGGASGVVAFLGSTEVDVAALLVAVAGQLPDYMVPRQVHLLAELPVNVNGKFDRAQLRQRLGRH